MYSRRSNCVSLVSTEQLTILTTKGAQETSAAPYIPPRLHARKMRWSVGLMMPHDS